MNREIKFKAWNMPNKSAIFCDCYGKLYREVAVKFGNQNIACEDGLPKGLTSAQKKTLQHLIGNLKIEVRPDGTAIIL